MSTYNSSLKKTSVRYIKPGKLFCIVPGGPSFERHYAVRLSSVPSRVAFRCRNTENGCFITFFGTTDCYRIN